jgi:TonB family protein
MTARLISVALLCGLVATAQDYKAPHELYEQARQELASSPAKRAEAERLLRAALAGWDRAPATKGEEYTSASVLLALLLLGNGTAEPQTVHALADEALKVYTTDDERLALALEIKAAVHQKSGDVAAAEPFGKRAADIRRRIIREMQMRDGPGRVSTAEPVRMDPRLMSMPVVISKREPLYSDPARIAKHQGAVAVSLIVDTDGVPKNIVLERSLGFGLDEHAYEAVREWRFRPAEQDGKQIPVIARIEVNFRLL